MAREVQIGDILKRIKRPISLIDDQEYKLVTIRMNHKGVVLREKKQGALIKSGMYEVRPGDFILSGIDARNGAFGIVPAELDGAIVTNDFWYFEINEEIISKELFLELTATTWFDEICKRGSDGTTQRIRLQSDKFFNQTILLPELEEQGELLTKIHLIKEKNAVLTKEIESQKSLLSQLKQSILQEAIQGKLTAEWRAQRQADGIETEPASELLKRIQAEKARLINPSTPLRAGEKKIKKEKPLSPITDSEEPFELPEGWKWCRLGDVIELISGQDFDKAYFSENPAFGIPYLTGASNLQDGIVILNRWTNIPSSIAMKGDLLLTCKGSGVGKMAFLNEERVHIARQLMAIRGEYVSLDYVKFLLSTNVESFQGQAKSLIPGIDRGMVLKTAFPLPPAEEQQNIVEKVESLMEKCRTLEDEISQSEQHAQLLMQAVLKGAFEN